MATVVDKSGNSPGGPGVDIHIDDPHDANITVGDVTAAVTVTATAAAPAYVEASTDNPLSSDLDGNLRVVVSNPSSGSGASVTANAVAPTLTEGSSDNPLSASLKGVLRVGLADLSTGDDLNLDAASGVFDAGQAYQVVAASQTDKVLGATGAAGDVLAGFWYQPTSTTTGLVTIKDNATTLLSIPALTNADTRPVWYPVGIKSSSGAFKVTTGAGVTVLAIGKFT